MSHRILRYSTSYLLINMSLRVATASAMSLAPHVLIHITSASESYNGYYVTVRRPQCSAAGWFEVVISGGCCRERPSRCTNSSRRLPTALTDVFSRRRLFHAVSPVSCMTIFLPLPAVIVCRAPRPRTRPPPSLSELSRSHGLGARDTER